MHVLVQYDSININVIIVNNVTGLSLKFKVAT